MAVVGEQLLTPDTGWQRINNTHDGIDYSNSNLYYTSATNAYETDMHYSWSIPSDSKVVFSFYGTKIRIICLNSNEQPDYSQNYVKIDDTTEDLYKVKQGGRFILAYEKTGLDEGIHKVEILLTQGTTFALDAIDIDETGYILALPKTVGDILTAPETGWKRIDDMDTHFKYVGRGWVTSTNQYLYNGNEHATNGLGDTVSFKFYGTKLRVLSGKFTNNPNNIDINIDGTSYKYDQSGTSDYKAQVILFEKLGLDLGVHTVIITSPSSSLYMALDCIDIDDTGYLVATVGDVLTAPENGWQRIDDTNSKIYYTGTWTQYTDSEAWNAGHTMTATIGDYLIFYVCSNNIRIISPINNNLSSNISIFIDSDTLSETYSIYNSSAIYNTIVYEKLNMENKYHKVMIKANTNAITLFDAVDIDSDGYLLTEKEYLQQTSQDKFPVMIGDDTIVSETNIFNYANTLVNGERKLLIADKLQALYVTDGNGSCVKVANNGLTVDDLSNIETSLTQTVTDSVRADFFSKTDTQDYVNNAVSNKVDKVDGYGLSENNFSNSYKNILDNLNANAFVKDTNYVHTDNNFTNIYKMKLDTLTNDSKYIGLFDTITDRDSYSGALSIGLWCSVLVDDNYGSKKTKYIYDGTQWNYAGTYNDDAFLIDDSATTDTNVGWSANKITNELKAKADKSETDTAIADINTELDKKLEVSNLKQGTNVSLDVDQYGNVTINATTGSSTGGSGTSDYELLSNKPKINGITILGDKSAKDLKLLSDSYASTENEGSVKMADKAKTIDITDQLIGSAQYYGVGNGGTLSDTALRLRPFPVGTSTNRIDTLDFDILTKDVPQSIPFAREIPNVNCFVQAFKKEDDEINITESFEDYTNELVSNHSEGINCDVINGLSINDSYEYNSELNADGLYETNIINKTDFIEILSIKCNET
jgi:hypothetical protein|nr:MAG TPA: carbohydrate esterase [Caudoviricetes sp.]